MNAAELEKVPVNVSEISRVEKNKVRESEGYSTSKSELELLHQQFLFSQDSVSKFIVHQRPVKNVLTGESED